MRIEEEPGGMQTPVREVGMMRMATAEAAPTAIAVGEIEISARVRAWYELPG
jgi:uncharacterized protein YggE